MECCLSAQGPRGAGRSPPPPGAPPAKRRLPPATSGSAPASGLTVRFSTAGPETVRGAWAAAQLSGQLSG